MTQNVPSQQGDNSKLTNLPACPSESCRWDRVQVQCQPSRHQSCGDRPWAGLGPRLTVSVPASSAGSRHASPTHSLNCDNKYVCCLWIVATNMSWFTSCSLNCDKKASNSLTDLRYQTYQASPTRLLNCDNKLVMFHRLWLNKHVTVHALTSLKTTKGWLYTVKLVTSINQPPQNYTQPRTIPLYFHNSTKNYSH